MRDPSSKPTATGARWSPSPDHATATARVPARISTPIFFKCATHGSMKHSLTRPFVTFVIELNRSVVPWLTRTTRTKRSITTAALASRLAAKTMSAIDSTKFAKAPLRRSSWRYSSTRRAATRLRCASPHDVEPHNGGPRDDVAPRDAEKPHGATKIDRSPPGRVGENSNLSERCDPSDFGRRR